MKSLTIIKDPLYGFVQITDPLIKSIIEHPYFQRLRRIKQMGMADFVFPGANHTRFQHSIGSMYLAQKAINTLKRKNIEISELEQQGLQLAALLHDIGHGPFSHSSEHLFFQNAPHETVTYKVVERLNQEFDDKLKIALSILKGNYPKKFLNQLIVSQIDLDRLDYLNRDSYFTGVSGVNFDIDRIIEMIDVSENHLVYDYKSLHTIEKFLLDRRFMTLQVYGHKNNILADLLLEKMWSRFKKVAIGENILSQNISFWITQTNQRNSSDISQRKIDEFLKLDDSDMVQLWKSGKSHPDKTIQILCRSLLNRQFPKIELSQSKPYDDQIDHWKSRLDSWQRSKELSSYFVFAGHVKSLTYSSRKDKVYVQYKKDRIQPLEELAEYLKSNYFSEDKRVYYLVHPK
ncbi:MAG: HD domain-containing protein [Flavobacteriaceae bacterium]|nr:HD domain-containing protein [Flavobacteriaceae bacterium]MCY4267903.1 HD domain-containing protein [Flavobacteriaceae bacterium]